MGGCVFLKGRTKKRNIRMHSVSVIIIIIIITPSQRIEFYYGYRLNVFVICTR